MPGIKQVVKTISDDVCCALAASGIGSITPVGTVTGVTNATPIVVTTAAAHGLATGQYVTVFNVNGDGQNPGFEMAANGAWAVSVIDATHFSLTGSSGNGNYTGGGTVVLGPLPDGRILFSQQHLSTYEQGAPPRIVILLRRSDWGGKGMYSPSTAFPPPDQREQWAARSIWTEIYNFEVHCWGIASPPDAEGGDMDAAQVLYQQVIRSVDKLMRGNWDLGPGMFAGEQPGNTAVDATGAEFVFTFKIGSPIPETTLGFAPNDVTPQTTFIPDPATG